MKCYKLLISSCVFGIFISCTKDTVVQEKKPELPLSKAETEKLEMYKAEVELGRNMAGRLLEYYGTNADEALLGYVNQVGNYVAGYSDYPERRYMFAILESPAVNAFACPGGYILVTLGTINMAQNEAELASILGHEIAHVGKQHMFKTLISMSDKDRDEAAAKTKGKPDDHLAVRERPSAENSTAGSLVARYLAGGAGLSILQAAKAGMNVILEKGLDKKYEFEADYEGTRYAIRAGYDPQAMNHFLNRLQKEKEKKHVNMEVLDKTHPKNSERMAHIDGLLKEMKAQEIVGAQGSERFQKYVSKTQKRG